MTTNNADGWCGVRHIPTDEVVATFKYAAHASLWGDGSYKGRYELVPIPAPGSVRVKALEWENHALHPLQRHTATLPWGRYQIDSCGVSWLAEFVEGEWYEQFASLDAAKAACQAHFESVVRGCVE